MSLTDKNIPKSIIFDFGNVVAFFDHDSAWERLARERGLAADAMRRRLSERGFAALLARYESGLTTSDGFRRGLEGMLEIELAEADLERAWGGIFRLNEAVAAILPRLKASGARLVLGSNTNEIHAKRFLHEYATTMSSFDAIVLSYEIGRLKPAVEFYAECVIAARATAGECLFIDDRVENVEGALRAGLTGLLYRDSAGLIEDLTNLGFDCGGSLS